MPLKSGVSSIMLRLGASFRAMAQMGVELRTGRPAGDEDWGRDEGLYQARAPTQFAGAHAKRSAGARGIIHLPDAGSTADCSGPETSRVPLLGRKWFWATPWATSSPN